MTLGSTLKQFVEGILSATAWTSANPFHTNKVKDFGWFAEPTDFDGVISADVVQIIKDEIKLQMNVQHDPIIDKAPTGSVSDATIINQARQASSLVQNPQNIVALGLRYLPHAALVALAFELVPIIFQEMTRDGSGMDLRWKRIIGDEINGFQDRQAQQDTRVGLRQVIATGQKGFIAKNGGAGTYNNLKEIRTGDTGLANSISITDHAKDMTP